MTILTIPIVLLYLTLASTASSVLPDPAPPARAVSSIEGPGLKASQGPGLTLAAETGSGLKIK